MMHWFVLVPDVNCTIAATAALVTVMLDSVITTMPLLIPFVPPRLVMMFVA